MDRYIFCNEMEMEMMMNVSISNLGLDSPAAADKYLLRQVEECKPQLGLY